MARQTCSQCGGRGTVDKQCPLPHTHYDSSDASLCYYCKGTGRVEEKCDTCGGSGYIDDGRSESSSSSYDSSSSFTPSSSGGRSSGPGPGDKLLSEHKQAFAFYNQKDFDNAIKHCNAVFDIAQRYVGKNDKYYAPFVAKTYNLRGACYNAKGNRVEAIVNYKAAVEWGDEDAKKNLESMGIQDEVKKDLSLLEEADQLFNAGNYDKAIAKYSRIIRFGESNKAQALMNRAACYVKKGDKDQAKDDYKDAINSGLTGSDLAAAKAELAKLK